MGKDSMPSALRAKTFQHRKEGRTVAAGQLLQQCPDSVKCTAAVECSRIRNHALVLHETALAIQTVPLADCIQRIKIRIVAGEERLLFFSFALIIECVECANAQRVQHPRRKIERNSTGVFFVGAASRPRLDRGREAVPTNSSLGDRTQPIPPCRMMSAHGDAAPKLTHRWPCCLSMPRCSGHPARILQSAKKLLQIRGSMMPHHHVCACYRDELERHFADDAGQPHAAHGGPEQLRVFSRQNKSCGCHRPGSARWQQHDRRRNRHDGGSCHAHPPPRSRPAKRISCRA